MEEISFGGVERVILCLYVDDILIFGTSLRPCLGELELLQKLHGEKLHRLVQKATFERS